MKLASLKTRVLSISAVVALAAAGTVISVASPALAYTPCVGVQGPCVGGLLTSVHATAQGSGDCFLVWSNQATWTATRSDTWFSVSPTSGRGTTSGSGSRICFTVQSNPNGYDRSGYIEVRAGDAYRYRVYIYQGGPKGARTRVAINPSTWNVDVNGDKDYFTVTTEAATWTATTSTSWLKLALASGASGEQFFVTADANLTGVARAGTVVVTSGSGSATLTVNQSGTPSGSGTGVGTMPAPTPTAAPTPTPVPTAAQPADQISTTVTTMSVPKTAYATMFVVATTPARSSYRIVTSASWIHSSSTTGTGGDVRLMWFDPNPGAARSATVNLVLNSGATWTITVNQAG
jgi:hypothetical protein